MSVRASRDTVTTSAHLAGGQRTTIAAGEHFLLSELGSLYMNTTERQIYRILLMDSILHLSDGRCSCELPGDGISSELHSPPFRTF
jgi:hypothetical protein